MQLWVSKDLCMHRPDASCCQAHSTQSITRSSSSTRPVLLLNSRLAPGAPKRLTRNTLQ